MSEPHDHPHPDKGLAPAVKPDLAPAPPIEDAGALALDEALRSSFKIVKFLMLGLVVAFVGSGLFTVNPNEIAVVLRFGKPVGLGRDQLLKPGLHWALPYPVDEIVRLPVGQSITAVSSNGWHAFPPEWLDPQSAPSMLRAGIDGYTITGDGNIIHTRATLKYRLQPDAAVNYYFGFANPVQALQTALDNALIYAGSRSHADAAIFRDKTAFTELVQKRLSQVLDQMKLNITVDSFEVVTMAPLPVKTAFDEVIKAQQTSDTEVSKAKSYAQTATNNAIGQAEVIWNDALTRSNQLVRTVQAEAGAFTQQQPFYQANPELFRRRLMTETMQRVLAGARDKFFIPARPDNHPRELRLQLNREPLKEKEKE